MKQVIDTARLVTIIALVIFFGIGVIVLGLAG